MNSSQIQSKPKLNIFYSKISAIKAILTTLLFTVAFVLIPFVTHADTSAIARVLETKVAKTFLNTPIGKQFASKVLGTPYSVDQYELLVSTLSKPEKSVTFQAFSQKISKIESHLIKKHGNQQYNLWIASGDNWNWDTRAIEQDLPGLLYREMKFSPRVYRPLLPKLDTSETMYRMIEGSRGVSQKILRYPIMVNPQLNPEGFIQFGFESEYTINSIGKLLSSYMPESRFGITKETWLSKTEAQRVDFVKTNLEDLFPIERRAGGLVKIEGDDSIRFMPEALIKDSTGNIEIVLSPVDTLEEWQFNIKLIQEKFGAGSMQGTISMSNEAYFSSNDGIQTAVTENFGMLNFFNEFDTLQKIQKGYERFKQTPDGDTIKSFSHPFLGPITKMKQNLLKSYLEHNSKGEWLSYQELRRISGNDDSFKYIGGTAYRPDIAPGKIILEVRDAHNQLDILTDRLIRSLYFFQFGKSQFTSATHFHAFDSINDFAKFPKKIQKLLKTTFPSRAYPGVNYTSAELTANEVFRNFAYPLKDWKNHIETFGDPSLRQKILTAQKNYIETLSQIATRFESGSINAKKAGFEIQGALGKFGEESTLHSQFQKWTHSNMSKNPYYNRYINLITSELAPFSSAFPESIWEGTLKQRVSRFIQTNTDNIKIIPDVTFTYKPEGVTHGISNNRNVMVISSHGLNAEQKNALMKNYLDSISRGTVSFPLSERAGHLYTRLGTGSLDYINSLNLREYPLPSGNRLEAVISLKPTEELKLRFLAERGVANPSETLGDFGMSGATSGDVSKVLRRSLPNRTDEHHNCTSWIATSAIGQNGERLFDLVGANASMEVHTNPGWWSYFLTGAATKERIPFIVYWTDKPMAEVSQKIQSGKAFPAWDFYLH